MGDSAEKPLDTTGTDESTVVHTRGNALCSADGNVDPALMPVPRMTVGRPASWERPAPMGGYRGTVLPEPDRMARRTMVLTNFLLCKEPGEFASKLHWCIKDYAKGAEDFLKPRPFFSERSDAVTAAEVHKACKDDGFAYRAIVRVYDNGHLVDVDFVREFMEKASFNAGCRIGWIAAIHAKPTVADERNRHFHVIIRGVTLRGDKLRLSSGFRRSGLKAILSDMMTKRVGAMSEAEIERAEMISEVNKERSAHLQGLGWRRRWAVRRAGVKA